MHAASTVVHALVALSLALLALPAGAEIRYIPLEEAESTRLCLLYTNRLAETEDELRKATVAGGSALGKTPVEANAIRTKLKFDKDYYQRKKAEACVPEDHEQQQQSEQDDDPDELAAEAPSKEAGH